MAEFNKILYSIDTGIAPQEFERLCLDMLFREGYRHIVPGGRTNDLGRDAEIRFWTGASAEFLNIVFQFSLEEKWERKLKTDADKVAKQRPSVAAMVFVTSSNVTVAKREKLRSEFSSSKGWDLIIFDREWLRLRLEQRDQDLAKKYFGLDLPASVAHIATLVQLTDFDAKDVEKLFRHASPESVRAALIEATRKEPACTENWKQLARLEYYLHNYNEALNAVTRCLQLETKDEVAQINLQLFKGAILAERGVTTNSRLLLIQAKDIFAWAVERVKRPVDHYNYANVLGGLRESSEAEKHYRICLERQPLYAQAWTNLANLLLTQDRTNEAMNCFAKALEIEPNLVEAHLSKARAYLLYVNKPTESVASFETALSLMPGPDQKGRYLRYWYAQSLLATGCLEDALQQVDAELLVNPGDKYLLDAKTNILANLWRKDARFETIALEFFRFRVRAVQNDFFVLSDLIHLCVKRGLEAEAWAAMQANIDYGGFTIREVAQNTGISLKDFAVGFANIHLYAQFRRRNPLEHHCMLLTEHGLTQNLDAFACLDQALVVPFGRLAQEVRAYSREDTSIDLHAAFEATTKIVSRLFAYFGPHWLAREAPSEQKEQNNLLSLGITLGFDVLVIEMSRQFRFLGGCFGLSKEKILSAEKCEWKEVQIDFSVDLMKQVMTEWKMIRVKASPGEGPNGS